MLPTVTDHGVQQIFCRVESSLKSCRNPSTSTSLNDPGPRTGQLSSDFRIEPDGPGHYKQETKANVDYFFHEPEPPLRKSEVKSLNEILAL